MNNQCRSAFPRFGDRLSLGRFAVSPFCIGIVDNPDTIAAAFEAGINWFFITADMHWPRYEATRIGLSQLLARVSREQVVVTGAAYVTQPEFCSEPFHELVRAVPGLHFLDVLVAGGAYATELAARLPIYLRHREQRHAGAHAIGASFHDRSAAVTAINSGHFDLAFIRYNPAHPGARTDVFPRIEPSRATRVLGFTSTGAYRANPRVDDDVWIPDITDHYRFALSSPLDGLLCSPQRPSEVAALAEALEAGPLSIEEQEHMIELAARGL